MHVLFRGALTAFLVRDRDDMVVAVRDDEMARVSAASGVAGGVAGTPPLPPLPLLLPPTPAPCSKLFRPAMVLTGVEMAADTVMAGVRVALVALLAVFLLPPLLFERDLDVAFFFWGAVAVGKGIGGRGWDVVNVDRREMRIVR